MSSKSILENYQAVYC